MKNCFISIRKTFVFALAVVLLGLVSPAMASGNLDIIIEENGNEELSIENLDIKADKITGVTKANSEVRLLRAGGGDSIALADSDGNFTLDVITPMKDKEFFSIRVRDGMNTREFKFRVDFAGESPYPPEDFLIDPDSYRISGSNRYNTSVEVSRRSYPNGADSVILASGTNTADALAAGPLAIEEDGPILLVANSLPAEVASEIERLDPSIVFIVGGEGTISKDIANSLSNRIVYRLAGSNRYGTSVKIAEYLNKNYGYNNAIITNGTNTVDALASSAYAGKNKAAILLSYSDKLPESVKNYIDSDRVRSVDAVGGSASVSANVVKEIGYKYSSRIFGLDRYDTAVNLARATYNNPKGGVIVSGDPNKLVDALSAAPLAYRLNMPILLVAKDDIPEATKSYLEIGYFNDFLVIGGSSSVSDDLITDLATILGPKSEEDLLKEIEDILLRMDKEKLS